LLVLAEFVLLSAPNVYRHDINAIFLAKKLYKFLFRQIFSFLLTLQK